MAALTLLSYCWTDNRYLYFIVAIVSSISWHLQLFKVQCYIHLTCSYHLIDFNSCTLYMDKSVISALTFDTMSHWEWKRPWVELWGVLFSMLLLSRVTFSPFQHLLVSYCVILLYFDLFFFSPLCSKKIKGLVSVPVNESQNVLHVYQLIFFTFNNISNVIFQN